MATTQKLVFLTFLCSGLLTCCSGPVEDSNPPFNTCIPQNLSQLKDGLAANGFSVVDSICNKKETENISSQDTLLSFEFAAYTLNAENDTKYLLSAFQFDSPEALQSYSQFIQDSELVKSPFIEKQVGSAKYSLSVQAQMHKSDLESHHATFDQVVNALHKE